MKEYAMLLQQEGSPWVLLGHREKTPVTRVLNANA